MSAGSVLAAFDGHFMGARPASRQERFAIELGKGIHDANALLTGTPNGISNALMALGILSDRLRECFGMTWFEEAVERQLL